MQGSERVILDVTIPVQPRPATVAEVDGWIDAASHRRPPAASDASILRSWLAKRHSRKYNQLIVLMRWAESEYAEGFGMLPEDVRWILP